MSDSGTSVERPDDAHRPPSAGSDQPSSSPRTFAFLNHSTSTVSDNLPPDVDDKPLARQRRRRTSPEDQAILEAAYARNSKPDKAARLELVGQVGLGEKEVQIWFQNRRQSSRRKSRPLLPHEIAQYQSSRLTGSFERPSTSSSVVLSSFGHSSEGYSIIAPQEPLRPRARSTEKGSASGSASPRVRDLIHPNEHDQTVVEAASSAGRLIEDSISAMEGAAKDLHQVGTTKRTSSVVRLSLDSEGNATIVTKDSSVPSPPRPAPAADGRNTGSEANSSQPVKQENPIQRPNLPALKRTASGRSRDSRAWEFWCDKESRSELESQAEKDASGSAVDAIGLLRSNSGRRILGQLPGKENVLRRQQTFPSKRYKLDVSALAMPRGKSSTGRLQYDENATYATNGKGTKSEGTIRIPGNESDKENWSPCSEVSLATTTGTTATQTVPFALSSERTGERHGTKALGRNSTRRSSTKADFSPEEDPEIAAFMKSGRRSSSVSGEEEMDCVQGLLSLSQGNWR